MHLEQVSYLIANYLIKSVTMESKLAPSLTHHCRNFSFFDQLFTFYVLILMELIAHYLI